MTDVRHETPAEQLLGVHFQRAKENGFTTAEQLGDRTWMYHTALRGIAKLRAADRAQQAPARVDEWNESWRLSNEQLADLHEDLRLVGRRAAVVENFEAYVRHINDGTVTPGLRPYQLEPFEATQQFVSNATTDILTSDEPVVESLTKGAYLEEPPSFGKTYFMAEIVKAAGVSKPASEHDPYPIRALVLTPRRKLVRQTIGKPTTTTKVERGFAVAVPDLRVTPYYSNHHDLSGDVVVMTYQSFINAVKSGKLDEHHFDLLLCDEAHRLLAPKTQEAINQYRLGRLTIGLTGSPDYDESRKLEHMLPNLIHKSEPLTGIYEGYINGFQYWAYRTGAQIVVNNTSSAEFTDAEIHPLIENEQRNRLILSIAKRDIESGIRGIIRCVRGSDCLHPKIIEKLAAGTQIRDPHTGEMRPMRVRAIDYKQDDILDELIEQLDDPDGPDALSYVGILNEGVDSAAIRFIIDAAPTTSQVVGKQVAGRGYRIDPEGRLTIFSQLFDDLVGRKSRYTFLHAMGITEFEQGLVVSPMQEEKEAAGRSSHGGHVSEHELPAELRAALIEDLSTYCAEQLELKPVYTEIPDDAVSVVTLTELGREYIPTLGKETVRHILQRAGFADPVFAKPEGLAPAYYYTSDAWDVLEAELKKVQLPPEGWRNRNNIVVELGSNTYRFDTFVKKHNLTGVVYNHPTNLVRMPYYSPEVFAQIEKAERKRVKADATDIEVLKLAREVGASPSVLDKFLTQREMQWRDKVARSGYMARFLDAGQAAEVRNYFGIIEGSLTISELGHVLGVPRTRVVTWLQSNGHLETVKRADHIAVDAPRLSNYGRRFTPDVIAEAIEALAPDEVDPDWVTLRDYAKERGHSYTGAKRLVDTHGVPIRRARDATTRSSYPILYLDATGREAFDAAAPTVTKAEPGERTMTQLKEMTGFSDFKIRSTMTPGELASAEPKIGTDAQGVSRRAPHFPAHVVKAVLERLGKPLPPDVARSPAPQKTTPSKPAPQIKEAAALIKRIISPKLSPRAHEPATSHEHLASGDKQTWMTVGDLLSTVRCDTKSFWILLRRIGLADASSFKRQDGAREVQIAPHVAEAFQKQARFIPSAPSGWYSVAALAEECHCGEQQIVDFVRVMTPQEQEVKLYRSTDDRGTITTHYNPRIVRAALQQLKGEAIE